MALQVGWRKRGLATRDPDSKTVRASEISTDDLCLKVGFAHYGVLYGMRDNASPSRIDSESPSFQSSKAAFHSKISMLDDWARARIVAVLPAPAGPVRARTFCGMRVTFRISTNLTAHGDLEPDPVLAKPAFIRYLKGLLKPAGDTIDFQFVDRKILMRCSK
jgi:hypothetical protein